jgi:hypothetical protein
MTMFIYEYNPSDHIFIICLYVFYPPRFLLLSGSLNLFIYKKVQQNFTQVLFKYDFHLGLIA